MRLVALSASAAMVALVSVALAQPKPPTSVATAGTTIAPQTQGAATAKCKKGSEVTGIGFSIDHVSSNDGYSGLNTAEPVSNRQLSVYLDNYDVDSHRGKAIGLCRRDGSYFTVRKSINIFPDDPQFNKVTAKCPRGSSVVGGGAEMATGYRDSAVLASRPKGERGWLVDGFTYEQNIQSAIAICDKSHDYTTKIEKRSVGSPFAAGARRTNIATLSANVKCPGKTTIMSGGFNVADSLSAQPSVTETRPKGDDAWYTQIRGFGFETLELKAYAICKKS